MIDYGCDSYRILTDVKNRILQKSGIKIHYLGGEHELLMYRALLELESGYCGKHFDVWMNSGGEATLNGLIESGDIYEKCRELREFLGSLDVYHKFPTTQSNGDNLLLVHAKAPRYVFDDCHLKISDNNREVEDAVSLCPENRTFVEDVISCSQIGKKGYFTIVGHTPLFKGDKPYKYHSRGNYLNIDGGCAYYASNFFEYDSVPLVGISNTTMFIVTFNHLNQIVAFSNGLSFSFSDEIKASYILDMRADLDCSRKESDSCAPRISNTEIDCVHIHRTNSYVDYPSEARSGGISIGGTRTVG